MSKHSIRGSFMRAKLQSALLSAIIVASGAGCSSSLQTVNSAPNVAQANLPFALEPNSAEEQFKLATRYESGDGIEADSHWAEYWAWRSARQSNPEALDWLRHRASIERREYQGIMVFGSRRLRGIPKEYPTAQIWLAEAIKTSSPGEDGFQEALSLSQQAAPDIYDGASHGDAWSQYVLGLAHELIWGEHAAARRWYEEASERNHVLAQYNLGQIYEAGRGVPQDSSAAAAWFRRAADQNYAPAQTMLGWMYDNGRGVEKNSQEAAIWFQKAAEQGDAVAQANLGFMFDKGRGVPENPAEAVRYYRKAAEQGVASAQNSLGALYDSGRGVPADEAEALRWFQLAARRGYAQAQNNIGVLFARKSIAQGDPNVPLAMVFKVAVQGDALAQHNLGRMYERGQGVSIDPTEALRWYTRAAQSGNVAAQLSLARLYSEGKSVPQNDAEAVRWLQAAANQGNSDAQYQLGVLYQNGRGVRKSPQIALEWFRKADAAGSTQARERIPGVECEASASTEVFNQLLRCTTRDSLRAALRSAHLNVVREDDASGVDTYAGDAGLGLNHNLKVNYGTGGRLATLTHELPAQTDAATHKRILAELSAKYGAPEVTGGNNPFVEARHKWQLGDGVVVEWVRAPLGKPSQLIYRAPNR